MVAKQAIIELAKTQEMNYRLLRHLHSAAGLPVCNFVFAPAILASNPWRRIQHVQFQSLRFTCFVHDQTGPDAQEPFERFKEIQQAWDKENLSRVTSMRQDMLGRMLLSPEELNMEVLRTTAQCSMEEQQEDEDQDCSESVHAEPKGSDVETTEQISAHISEAEFMSVSNIVRG